MRKALLGVVALNVIAAGAFAADTATQALEKRTSEFAAAWNRHDTTALAGFWLPDGDLLNPFGRWAKGRNEIAKLLAEEHSTVMKATTFTVNAVSVRTPSPDVAVADWDMTIAGMTGPDGSMLPVEKLHAAMVWVKRGGTWSIMAGRPMIPAPVPAPPMR